MKGQALADFVVEATTLDSDDAEGAGTGKTGSPPAWTLHVDGSAMKEGCGAGVVLRTPVGSEIKYSVTLGFPATNNVAEYEALIAGLRLAKECSARDLVVYSDSELVINQVLGNFEANHPQLSKYLMKVKGMTSDFEQIEFVHILRENNEKADSLAKAAASGDPEQYARGMRETLERPTVDEPETMVMPVSDDDTWMTAYLRYLADGILPEDPVEAKKVKKTAGWYAIVDGRLYRRGFSTPYLRCLTPVEAEYALQEVHLGICGSHIGGKNLAFKIMRQGYYWPTMKYDAVDFVRKCENCQVHGNLNRQPHTELRALQSPWPFAQWGLDILGPLPIAAGQRKFLMVGIDYFTKWVEATPLARITEQNATEFLRQSIVCRYGVPECVITDNGTQFTGKRFSRYCARLRINLIHTSVAYPQANGQVEVTNRTILHGLKTKLIDSGGSWVDELPSILWSYRTTPRESTKETPFSLCYGVEAVIPVEVGLPSLRVEHFNPDLNSQRLREHLDLLEEARDRARLSIATYQQRVARYYNKKVKARQFEVGDLVLRSIEATGKNAGRNKLSPNWEGPFLVSAILRDGAYKLRSQEGRLIPRTWNAMHLRKYYQ
ncbi:hypothetical protein Nepgr_027434 [Nepenthes gracilis]|uniref:Uncharacterized protein n=1 Tax=Nepenthes gracilis TaxID=150966 RepID=A0AAD3Y3J0_NEPGR|nr:hypothetical protein Nepgr_027434 [Nepenthes gracilis]